MPRRIEIFPRQVRKGDILVDDAERVQWTAVDHAHMDSRGVRICVELPTSTAHGGSREWREWVTPDEQTTILRILRRSARF